MGTIFGCYLGHDKRFCWLGDKTSHSVDFFLFAELILKQQPQETR
jgi:hypothetical protein